MKIKYIILMTSFTYNNTMQKEINKKEEKNINTLQLLQNGQMNHPLIIQQFTKASQNFVQSSYNKTLQTFINSAIHILNTLNSDYQSENMLKIQTTEKCYSDLFTLACSSISKLSTKFSQQEIKRQIEEIKILSDDLTNTIKNSKILLLNEDTQKHINIGLNYLKLIPSETNNINEIQKELEYIKTIDESKENTHSLLSQLNTLMQHLQIIKKLLNDSTLTQINKTILSETQEKQLAITKNIMTDDFFLTIYDFTKQTEKILNMRKITLCITKIFFYMQKGSFILNKDEIFTKTKQIFAWTGTDLIQLIKKCKSLIVDSIYQTTLKIKDTSSINSPEIITHLLPCFQNINDTTLNALSNNFLSNKNTEKIKDQDIDVEDTTSKKHTKDTESTKTEDTDSTNSIEKSEDEDIEG